MALILTHSYWKLCTWEHKCFCGCFFFFFRGNWVHSWWSTKKNPGRVYSQHRNRSYFNVTFWDLLGSAMSFLVLHLRNLLKCNALESFEVLCRYLIGKPPHTQIFCNLWVSLSFMISKAAAFFKSCRVVRTLVISLKTRFFWRLTIICIYWGMELVIS